MPKTRTASPAAKAIKIPSGGRLTDDSFRLLVSRVRDYAIFMLDPEGNVASWNEGASRIKGYTADEIIGQHISVFYTPEDRRRKHPLELLEIARTTGRVEEEGWRVRKDGTRFWADVIITAVVDDHGVLRGFAKVTRDLTERKIAEDALAELSGRLLRIQDSERRRISRELHDTTSPLLTSLTAKLYAARLRAKNKDPEMADVVDQTLALCEATTTMIRTISSMLHPAMLEQSGLIATMRWYLETLGNRTGLRVESTLPEQSFRPEPEVEIALFRLTQEWLNAVLLRGDRAVTVLLAVTPSRLELRMESPAWAAAEVNELNAGRGSIGVFVAATKQRLRQMGGAISFKTTDSTMALIATVPRTAPK